MGKYIVLVWGKKTRRQNVIGEIGESAKKQAKNFLIVMLKGVCTMTLIEQAQRATFQIGG